MYKHILVPFDGGEFGEHALPVAEQLADSWNAELVIASFLLAHESVEEQESVIERQVAHLRHRPRTIIRPVVHTVADEIADELDESPDTLVVMATRGHSHLAAFLGSVADEVLKFTAAPTVLIGPKCSVDSEWPTGPMVVCTDGSATADAIIAPAAAFSAQLELHPWVITVSESNQIPTGPGDWGMESNGVSNVAKQLNALGTRPADYEVLHGKNPASRIVEYATTQGAALIALGTHGATGFRRLALGSVAMAVVQTAPCPVLVARS